MPRYTFRDQNSPLHEQREPTVPARATAPSLETDYPRVLQAIQAMWGYKELNAYFRRLTIDERGDRDGFPPEVWEEIYLLLYLHQEIVPDPLF